MREPYSADAYQQEKGESLVYKVRIDKFEGPFDLLIYLLENARMDIYDIKVAEITEQYIAYLKEMEALNVEVDTEFIVLAAILIRLKSRMLLPRINTEGELEIIEDPRVELRGRLLDYMRIKKASELLAAAEEYNLAVHEKPAEDMSVYLENPDEILRVSDEQMVNAFILFLTRRKKVEEVTARYQRVSMIKNMEYDARQAENFGEITVVRKDPEILAAQADAEAAGVIEYADDEFDDEFNDEFNDEIYTETEISDVQQ